MARGTLAWSILKRIWCRDGGRIVLRIPRIRYWWLDPVSGGGERADRDQAWLGPVSRHGVFDFAPSLDHVGPMVRSATDAALLLSVIWGPDPLDPTSLTLMRPDSVNSLLDVADLTGVRVGIDPVWNASGSDALTLGMIDSAASALGGLGAELRQVQIPDASRLVEAWEPQAGVEAAVAHAATFSDRGSEYGSALHRLLTLGHETSGMAYQRIALERMDFWGRLDRLMQDVDLLLTPVQPYAAPTLAQLGALARDPEANSRLIQYTSSFNFSGHPAASLPGGTTEDGLPLGFQLVARHGEEALLCRAALAYQHATDWHLRRPDLVLTIAPPAARRDREDDFGNHCLLEGIDARSDR